MWRPITSPSVPDELLAGAGGVFSGAASDGDAGSLSHQFRTASLSTGSTQPPISCCPPSGGKAGLQCSPIRTDWLLNVAAVEETPPEPLALTSDPFGFGSWRATAWGSTAWGGGDWELGVILLGHNAADAPFHNKSTSGSGSDWTEAT